MAATGYHFHGKIISRKAGQSAVAAIAYRTGDRFRDERTGELKDYSHKRGVEFVFHAVPKAAPEWAQDIESAWNMKELAEDKSTCRATAQLARDYDLAFPYQLDAQQREWMLKDFVREEFTRKNLLSTAAIHEPSAHGDKRNHHAHIMVCDRTISADGFNPAKERHWKTHAEQKAYEAERLEQMREKWAELGARQLERAGLHIEAERWRHGHKTLEEQRAAAIERGDLDFAKECEREPGEHRGPHVDAMERKGKQTDRGEECRAIEERNRTRADLAEVSKQLAQEQQKEKELGKTAAEIRLAYSLTNSGKGFAEALEDRGLILAEVTREEAAESHRRAEFAKATGNFAPYHREGELVVVNQSGKVYRINERTTGDNRAEVDKYLATVDRAALPSVTDAQAIAREVKAASFLHRQGEERQRLEEKQAEARAAIEQNPDLADSAKGWKLRQLGLSHEIESDSLEARQYKHRQRAGIADPDRDERGKALAADFEAAQDQKLLLDGFNLAPAPAQAPDDSAAAFLDHQDRTKIEADRDRAPDMNRPALGGTVAQGFGMAASVATKAADRFADLAGQLLDMLSPAPPPVTWRDYLASKEARERHFQEQREQGERDATLWQIIADRRQGKDLNPDAMRDELRKLNRNDLEKIKTYGEDGLKQIIADHEREIQRQRETDRGRER